MKWIHTSDLHIGKMFNDFSLLEDQKFFLDQLTRFAVEQKADAVVIAGDLYDRSVPSAEAVEVLGNFLCRMTLEENIPVLAIAGNHDSPQRLDFGSELMRRSGLYLAGKYHKRFNKVTLNDSFGPVHFYLSPYLEPALVRLDFPEESIRTYDEAFQRVLQENRKDIDSKERNVFVGHGFFSYLKNPDSVARSESEVSLGGSDLIDASGLSIFDYAALGHIHRPQQTGEEKIRYSGSPLVYSLSEIPFAKSVSVVELKEKGDLSIETVSLPVLRKTRIIEGYFDEIMTHSPLSQGTDDLVYFSLSDHVLVPNAMNRLRAIYPNALGMRLRSSTQSDIDIPAQHTAKPIDQLFADFFESINERKLTSEQQRIIESVGKTVLSGGDADETDSSGI